nr:hypothetical protein [uncultured Gellertiella sp.]
MAISADEVFAETMTAEMIAKSDQRTRELLEAYPAPLDAEDVLAEDESKP